MQVNIWYWNCCLISSFEQKDGEPTPQKTTTTMHFLDQWFSLFSGRFCILLSGSFVPICTVQCYYIPHRELLNTTFMVIGNKLSSFFFSWHDAIHVSHVWNKCIARDTFVACKSALDLSLVCSLEQEKLDGIAWVQLLAFLVACWETISGCWLAGNWPPCLAGSWN